MITALPRWLVEVDADHKRKTGVAEYLKVGWHSFGYFSFAIERKVTRRKKAKLAVQIHVSRQRLKENLWNKFRSYNVRFARGARTAIPK
jgi:hypothetical protein